MIDVRQYISGIRNAYGQRARLLALLTDWSVPSRRRLSRFWREICWIIADSDEWLSWRTESLRDIRFRRQRAERTTAAENFHRRLHSLHSITRSLLLGAGVFAFALVISVIAGAVYGDADVPDHIAALSGTLVTVAQVLGGAAGILFAVIVFGIQFHGEKLDKAAFLVRYLRRREGLIPIAAFTLGVVAANVIVSLICSLGLAYAAVPMAMFDVPLVLLVLGFVLWLIHRMAVSVSEDPATLLMPSLTFEYDRALDEDIHHAKQMVEFERALAATGMKYSTVAGLSSLDRVAPVKLNLRGRGCVRDINLTALEALGKYVRSACPNHEATLSVGPRDSVDDMLALVLSARRDDQGRQIQDAVAPDDEVVCELQRHLQAVFCLGTATKHDVVEVLDRFQTMLVGYARSASEEELDRWLEVQGKLMERGLERADAVPSSFSIHRERLPDFLGGFQPFEMAKNAVASGDQEKVSVLLTFAYRIMATAVRQEQHGLYHRAGRIIEAIYDHAIAGEKLADYVGRRIDSMLHSLSAQFEYAHSSWRRDSFKIGAQIPVLIVDLGWRFRLLRDAIEAGRKSDATHFQDRFFLWDHQAAIRSADDYDEQNIPAELRQACDLITYTDITVAAWCLYLVEQNHKHTDTAKIVFQKCANDLGTREQLVLLWETVRGRLYGGTHIDDLLGVTHLTMPSPDRVGIPVIGCVREELIERGLVSLLLQRSSSRNHAMPTAFRSTPAFRPRSQEEVKAIADAILGNDAVRTGLLNIAGEKRDGVVKEVAALFGERLRLFNLGELQRIISGQVDDARRTVLANEILAGLCENRGIVPALEQIGAAQAKALPSAGATAVYAMTVPKEHLVSTAEGETHFGEYLAEGLREQESIEIALAAEKQSESIDTCDDLRGLAGAVRSAQQELASRGYTPCVVFLPQPPRFIKAIAGTSAWGLPGHSLHGDYHLGDWELCHLLRWPYVNPSSVVVLDAPRFYGSTGADWESGCEFLIEEPYARHHEQWLADAAKETDASGIPDAHKVCVVARVRVPIAVGVCDAKAAVRIDLDLTKLGYALLEGEEVYHRPDCDLLRDRDNVTHSLDIRLATERTNRKPCERCRPGDWDAQTEHEVQDALSAE